MIRLRRYLLAISAVALLVGTKSIAALTSAAPGLGTATSFAVLAGSTVTSTGNTVINGDLGVSPGTACTGLPAPCTGGGPGTVSGTINAGDAPAAQAQTDLTAAYDAAALSACDFDKTGQDLGGQTLTPGTYCFSSSSFLTGILTLSGDGVFIFKAGSTVITAPDSIVVLINGARRAMFSGRSAVPQRLIRGQPLREPSWPLPASP